LAPGAARLPRAFYDRPAQEVAPALLGCVLEHETADGLVAAELTEVEAYAGDADPASHAYRGRTTRNAVMFGPPGHVYVYFTYGMHFCVNVVCGPPGVASAVLLRAGRIIAGEDLARSRRAARATSSSAAVPAGPGSADPVPAGPAPDASVPAAPDSTDYVPVGSDSADADRVLAGRGPARILADRDLARGPARLCQALAIDRAQDGADLCAPASPIRLRGPVHPANAATIRTGPRVGIRTGAEMPWRFWTAGDPTVSAYRPHAAIRDRSHLSD
jgi:DNA-3-methyladenine glycosylase